MEIISGYRLIYRLLKKAMERNNNTKLKVQIEEDMPSGSAPTEKRNPFKPRFDNKKSVNYLLIGIAFTVIIVLLLVLI